MEELKLILETVASLGTEAKWAFFAWLGYKAFCVFAILGTILILASWVGKLIARINDETEAVRQLADAFGHSTYDTRGLVTKILNERAK